MPSRTEPSQAFETFRDSGLVQDWHTYQSKRKATHKCIAAAKHEHQQKLSAVTVTQAYNDMTNDDRVLGERDMWQYYILA
jgi:hypothetical protein